MATILIIDDEKSIRRTLREILEYEGYKVEEANDGVEGKKLRRYSFRYQDAENGRAGGVG